MADLTDIWHDRRVNIGYETAEELAKHAHPLNWRGHPESQASATNDALDSLGWIDEIKVNINTGNVFNGHLRISLALAKDPAMRLPVDYYDLSPDEEALALQVLDATTEMAEPIPDKLAALLARTRALTSDRPGLAGMLERLKERAGISGNGQRTNSAGYAEHTFATGGEDIWVWHRNKDGDLLYPSAIVKNCTWVRTPVGKFEHSGILARFQLRRVGVVPKDERLSALEAWVTTFENRIAALEQKL